MTDVLATLRAAVSAATPGPWEAADNYADNGGLVTAIMSSDYDEVVGEGSLSDEDRQHIINADRLARFVASPEAEEALKRLLEQAMWSPASGPVMWTDEKIAAAKEQAAYLARSILTLLAEKALG